MMKECDQVMRVRSRLKKFKAADLGLPEGIKLYIDESCVPCMGFCGNVARNDGISANYFIFYWQWFRSYKPRTK